MLISEQKALEIDSAIQEEIVSLVVNYEAYKLLKNSKQHADNLFSECIFAAVTYQLALSLNNFFEGIWIEEGDRKKEVKFSENSKEWKYSFASIINKLERFGPKKSLISINLQKLIRDNYKQIATVRSLRHDIAHSNLKYQTEATFKDLEKLFGAFKRGLKIIEPQFNPSELQKEIKSELSKDFKNIFSKLDEHR